MKVYYIWDAYCGWCYGFKSILMPFIENHPELDLEVISGGLFDAGKTLADYPHIPGANARIADIYGVEFTEDYQALLEDDSLELDSFYPAAAFGVMRDKVDNNQLANLSGAVQDILYKRGLPLGEVETYRQIAEDFGMDVEETLQEIEAAFELENEIHPDFIKAHQLNATSFPTLIIEKDGTYYDLRGDDYTLEGLEQNLDRVKEI